MPRHCITENLAVAKGECCLAHPPPMTSIGSRKSLHWKPKLHPPPVTSIGSRKSFMKRTASPWPFSDKLKHPSRSFASESAPVACKTSAQSAPNLHAMGLQQQVEAFELIACQQVSSRSMRNKCTKRAICT
eukprot:1155418-Pelagomonas_calceolata.AAC.3